MWLEIAQGDMARARKVLVLSGAYGGVCSCHQEHWGGPWPEGPWRRTCLGGDMRLFHETFPWKTCFLLQVTSVAKLVFHQFFMAVIGYSWIEGEGGRVFLPCSGHVWGWDIPAMVSIFKLQCPYSSYSVHPRHGVWKE